MTSGLYLGGDKHTDRSLHREQVRSSQFFPTTYASAAYEPDANVSPPATSSLLANLALGERPLFSDVRSFFEPSKFREALLNVLLIGGAVGMIVIMATIVLVVPYWVFFAES